MKKILVVLLMQLLVLGAVAQNKPSAQKPDQKPHYQGPIKRNPDQKPTTTNKPVQKPAQNKTGQSKAKPVSGASSNRQTKTFGTSTYTPSVKTYTVDGVSFQMVEVRAGSFTMGATSEQENPWDDEKPAHRVTLTSDYWMGATEVTQALWKAVMGSNPSEFIGDERPVESVSWDDCQAFIAKLNRITGKRFRLPTEAEWEYAARGGSKSRGYQYAGGSNVGNVAWYYDNAGDETHPVGQLRANELGLYDMSGNVWEWCQDWYGSYSSGSQTNPTGPSCGSDRVLRGGSWGSLARGCRSSYRDSIAPGRRYSYDGFRLVLSE